MRGKARPSKTPPGTSAKLKLAETQLRLPQFQLSVLTGPDQGLRYNSTGEHTLIGSDPSADLILSDRTVSRFHAEFRFEHGQLLLRDLGSRNGTRLGGVSVLAAKIEPGATFSLGRTQLGFEIKKTQLLIPLSERQRFGALVGRSATMRAAFAQLEKAAASDAAVLLEAEPGAGAEEAARSIHLESPRKDRPLCKVNCAALPTGRLEQALSTALQAAEGGTLFLDAVGELSPSLQPKLLKALDRKTTRVIAATAQDLRCEVNARRFRSDLYYRLATITVRLPPLRERAEDLPLLVEQYLSSLPAQAQKMRSAELRAELARRHWPRNLSELHEFLERCLG